MTGTNQIGFKVNTSAVARVKKIDPKCYWKKAKLEHIKTTIIIKTNDINNYDNYKNILESQSFKKRTYSI